MSAFGTLLSGPLAQAIGWALVHLLWQGVLVAAILAASLALMPRQSANARYLASCGALLLLIVLGAATAYRVYEPAAPAAPLTWSVAATPEPEVTAATDDPVAAPATPSVTWPDRAAAVVLFANAHLSQVVLAWMTGVLLLSLRLLCGWIRAHRIATRDTVDATPDWQRTAKRLAEALRVRGAIRLLESAAVEVPTVIGWLRPVVLLPVATLSGLSADQMEMVLAHELAHIRRHDFFVNLTQAFAETLLFYHPAVWWISSRIRAEREHCCDDVAVSVTGNALLYARALTRLEELRVDPAQAVLAANGGSLIARIRRIAGARAEAANGPSRWAAGVALLTVLAALLITPSLPLHADGQAAQAQPAPPAAPAQPPAPAPQANQAKCSVDVVAADDESDNSDTLEAPLPEPDDAEAPQPAMAPAPMALSAVNVEAVMQPAVHAMELVAPAIAASVASGIEGGVPGGVVGGVVGGLMAGVDTPRPGLLYRRHDRRNKIGASGKLTVDDLIELRASGVTPAYIEEMRGAGLGEVSLDDIAAMRIQGISARYVTGMRNAGMKIDDPETAITLRIQGVTPEYVASMKAAGYGSASAKDLVSLRIMGVTPAYVKQLADSGYRNLSVRDLTSLKAQGVTPELIKALADAGYANLSVRDLGRMAAVGVNAEFIRDLSKYRTK